MKYPLMVALSLLMVMGASTIGCITPTDLAEDAEGGSCPRSGGRLERCP